MGGHCSVNGTPTRKPSAQTLRKVKRRFPEGSQLPRTPANSHLVQPRRTNSREFSGRPTRGNSRIEGTRPVRSGLPPPPSRLPNLDREETRAGFPYSFRAFAGVGAPRDARDVRIAPHYRSRCAWALLALVEQFPRASSGSHQRQISPSCRTAVILLVIRAGRVPWHDSDRFDGTVRARESGQMAPGSVVRCR